MTKYVLILRKGHWTLLDNETKGEVEVFHNRAKAEAIALMEQRFKDETCAVTVMTGTDKIDTVVHFPALVSKASSHVLDRMKKLARTLSGGE